VVVIQLLLYYRLSFFAGKGIFIIGKYLPKLLAIWLIVHMLYSLCTVLLKDADLA